MVRPLEILQRFWGHSSFRPKQEEIVTSILNGNDTLALLPTGGGKSVCFQVPALCMEGMCVVISPLLALMDDQVKNLQSRGIAAASINSTMPLREIDKTLDLCVQGKIKFLYVAPERLSSILFRERFKRMPVSLLAVDEAHCISQWGYDFRPSYLEISEARLLHPEVPVLALTASATPAVVADIQRKLKFKLDNVIGTGFGRPQLAYVVRSSEDKEAILVEILRKIPGSSVVYCSTRAKTREMANALYPLGISAEYYHAGLSPAQKEKSFARWMKNEVRVMCATNAFGMGIDKPDVRTVIHMDVPASPEAYFQEAGRAGRDGHKAYGILLYNAGDLLTLKEKVKLKYPPKDYIRKVYQSVCNYFNVAIGAGQDIQYEFDISDFCKKFLLKPIELLPALKLLESAGYLLLNEGVHQPSKITVTVGKQELYSFQITYPSMDGFIKQLLRLYGGLFDQYIPIRESEISYKLRISEREVVDTLKILQQQKIIDYQPASETPRITLLTGRQNQDKLIFSREIYEDRLKVDQDRSEAMVRYIEKDQCRSVQLLSYFGEKEPTACGICDVCLKHKKQGVEAKLWEDIWRDLCDLLLHEQPTLDELHEKLPHYPTDALDKLVRWKLDQNELALDDLLRLTLPGL